MIKQTELSDARTLPTSSTKFTEIYNYTTQNHYKNSLQVSSKSIKLGQQRIMNDRKQQKSSSERRIMFITFLTRRLDYAQYISSLVS